MSVKHSAGIARKLSRKLTRKLFLTFISVDILLVIISACAVLRWLENDAAGKPQNAEIAESTAGFEIPEKLGIVFPEGTRNGYRNFRFAYEDLHRYNMVYDIYFYSAIDGNLYHTSYKLDSLVDTFVLVFSIIIVIELFILFGRARSISRSVQKMLLPISDFTAAAESIGVISDTLRTDELVHLRGALEGINGNALDIRLEVDNASPELTDLANAINGMLDRVGEAYAAQIRFVSDASHELRTPISVIQGYAALLDRWGKNDEKILQEGIDAIKFEADSMKELVERLLFLARGDSGKLELRRSPFDLGELIEETVEEYKLIDPEHDYSVESETLPITADRAQLKEALRIFIDNAKKYTDSGGSISVKCGYNEFNNPFFSVTDTGCGISPEDLPKIFERFHRADASRARSSGGAGLGLAIARRIISASGGTIQATSRLGIGTRMTVIL